MSGQEEYECIVRIRNFSDENQRIPVSAKVETEALPIVLHVFAIGMHADDLEYVTIELQSMGIYYEIRCVVSVLDAAGNRRFPTSHVFCPERENAVAVDFHPFMMDRVVKRETLLRQPDELLPEDCLTLHIHIFTKRITFEDREIVFFPFELSSGGSEYARLPLDSVLAKRLTGVSSYFRALSEAPMLERQRGYATFSLQEFLPFRSVCDILLGKKIIIIHSVEHLLQTSNTADKFDVPPVLESCRGMLSVLLRAAGNDPVLEEHVMDEITDFSVPVHEISDTRLREIFESFLERNREDSNEDNRTEERAADRLEAGWRLDHADESYSYFAFVRDAVSREDEFEFYQ